MTSSRRADRTNDAEVGTRAAQVGIRSAEVGSRAATSAGDDSEARSQAALRDAVLEQLAVLEHIAGDDTDGPDGAVLSSTDSGTEVTAGAADGDLEARLRLARSKLYRLTDGWRLLLTVHSADADGRCQACPGRVRHRRWPCAVWLLAHHHLLGETLPRTAARRRFLAPRWLDPRRWLIRRADDRAGSRLARGRETG
jgi:hypothetical protein